jgi:hypothetical protein
LHQHQQQQQQQQQLQQLSQQQSASSKKQRTINDAITSSLSSSINMKRGRDNSSSDSSSTSSDESDVLDTSKSRLVAPGLRRWKADKKRARLSTASSVDASAKKRVAFSEKEMPKSMSTPTSIQMSQQSVGRSSLTKKFVLPTISQIIGGKKLSPKKILEGIKIRDAGFVYESFRIETNRVI